MDGREVGSLHNKWYQLQGNYLIEAIFIHHYLTVSLLFFEGIWLVFGDLRCGPEEQEGLCRRRIHRANGPLSTGRESVVSWSPLYLSLIALFSGELKPCPSWEERQTGPFTSWWLALKPVSLAPSFRGNIREPSCATHYCPKSSWGTWGSVTGQIHAFHVGHMWSIDSDLGRIAQVTCSLQWWRHFLRATPCTLQRLGPVRHWGKDGGRMEAVEAESSGWKP